jgi:hypothetical protein
MVGESMKKSKIITILLVLVIIINVLIMIDLILKKAQKINQGSIKSAGSPEYTQPKTLNVKNSSNLSKMDLGYINKANLYDYTNKYVTKFLPDLYKQINEKVDFSNNYYKTKRTTIYNYSHIYKYADFVELIETMKKSGINFDEYKTIEFVSCINNDEKIILKCELTYEGDKKIDLQLTYLNGEIKETKLKM